MIGQNWPFAYLALGAVAGLLAGMFGVGGGLLLVPVLLMLFAAQQFPPEHMMHLALGTSMATILFTSIASARKHHEHGAVNWSTVFGIAPGILLGTALGGAVAASVSPLFLTVFFALFVYFAAAQILFDVRPNASRQLPGKAGLTLFGTFTGWLSTLVSIGGGTLVVPFLIWCNVPLRRAIGTSAAIGFPVALGGSIAYLYGGLDTAGLPPLSLGYIYLPAMMGCALASLFTAPMGARLAHHIDVALLRKLFAVLLLILATRMLLKISG